MATILDSPVLTATTAFAVPARDELPDTFPKGRVCEHVHIDGERCDTVLSIYNGERFCYCHHRFHRDEILAGREGLLVGLPPEAT